MKVEIFYEAPMSQVLTLTDEQAELFTEYESALERTRELQRSQGWTDETMESFSRVDDAYDEFVESINSDLDYPDLGLEDIEKW